WRAVRIAVLPGERCASVAELRAQESPERLMLLAMADGAVVGSGMADRAESAGVGFAAPRILPEHRRRGFGSVLLGSLAAHCTALGRPVLRAHVDDEGSLAFATRFGFVEVDRQIEQLRAIAEEPSPGALPAGLDVVLLSEHPELWPGVLRDVRPRGA